MNILLLGSGEIGIFGVRALHKKGHNLFVLTDPGDKGKGTWKPSLLAVCRKLRVPVDNPPQPYLPKKFIAQAAFSLQYGKILKKDFLDSIGVPILNFHTGPLPELRGLNTCSWAIINRLKDFGVTVHIIDEGIDTGPIVKKVTFPITSTDTAWSLYKKNNNLMRKIFVKNINSFIKGKFKSSPVKPSKMVYRKKGDFDFSRLKIDSSLPIEDIDIFIRSRVFPPIQLPYIEEKGKKKFVIGSEIKNKRLYIAFKNGKIKKIL